MSKIYKTVYHYTNCLLDPENQNVFAVLNIKSSYFVSNQICFLQARLKLDATKILISAP